MIQRAVCLSCCCSFFVPLKLALVALVLVEGEGLTAVQSEALFAHSSGTVQGASAAMRVLRPEVARWIMGHNPSLAFLCVTFPAPPAHPPAHFAPSLSLARSLALAFCLTLSGPFSRGSLFAKNTREFSLLCIWPS